MTSIAGGVLTPGPSTDLSGQKPDLRLSTLDASFALPPAALSTAETRSSSVSSTSTDTKGSDSSYRPVSPLSPIAAHKPAAAAAAAPTPSPSQARKRSTMQRVNGQSVADYALPPPPTRTRKIIQMKPKGQDMQDGDRAGKASSMKTSPSGKGADGNAPATSPGGKRKTANGTTAASRKVARKTAHSLIERRRRSKMNEEFGTLKDMIPACSGQEMHKLAILQASIEYMRYLEQCVSDLKTATKSRRPSTSKSPYALQPQQQSAVFSAADHLVDDSDEEMSDAGPSPSDTTPSNPPSTFSVVSPQLQGSAQTSPALTAGSQQFYFRQPLTLPSPAFGPQRGSPQQARKDVSNLQSPTTMLPSPTLLPQADHEATAALMMLGTDRRSWDGDKPAERRSANGARGMSVRDLLSGS